MHTTLLDQTMLKDRSRYILLALTAVLSTILWPASATAQTPQASLSVPPTAMIGDTVTFTVSLDNTSVLSEGYGPFLDVVLPTNGADGAAGTDTPDGLSFLSATSNGAGITPTILVFSDDDGPGGPGTTGCVDHPLAVDDLHQPLPVCGTAGDTLLVFELPFGSLVPDQPPIPVTIVAQMSNLADLGHGLDIRARGGFRFGADALDNPCCDLVILHPNDPDSSAWPAATVTPTLATITKVYDGPEDETATGPDFPRTHTITVEVAPGQTVADLDVFDDLPNNVAYTGIVSAPGAVIVSEPSIGVAANAPANRLHLNFPTLTGTVDVVIGFFVPQFDADGQPVNPPASGDDSSSTNTASMLGDWTPLDGRDLATGGTDVVTGIGTSTFAPKSIAVQKSHTIVIGGSPTPGDTIEYTITFQVSDFFAFTDLVITDVISDGQRFDGTFAPTLSLNEHGASVGNLRTVVTPNYSPASPLPNDGTTEIEFFIEDGAGLPLTLLGGCVPATGTGGPPVDCSVFSGGATTGTITFRTVIQEEFSDDLPSGDESVDHGDVLTNDVTIDANVLSTTDLSPTGSSEADASNAEVTIANGSLAKAIYAINGNTVLPAPLEIMPGDTVTYQISFDLPSSDFENLVLTDYLPLPVFDASEVMGFVDPGAGIPPAAGTAWYASGDTFYALAGYHPAINTLAAANSIVFDYGTYDNPASIASQIDLLFTVTVNDEPFADELFLTNQATAANGSTNAGTAEDNAIVQITLREPYLQVTKGAIGADNPDAVFNPTTTGPPGFPSTPVTSGDLAGNPVDSDVAGLDAGDIMSFSIVIENTGGAGGFDLVIHDTIPPGFAPPAGGINLQIVRGDGYIPTLLTTGGTPLLDPNDLFGPGIQLDDSGGQPLCQPYNAPPGTNIIIVTYDLEIIDPTLVPGSFLQNLGGVTNYAGSEGGPNHVDDPIGFTDSATVTLTEPGLAKSVFETEINSPTNGPAEVVIGELVTYDLVVAVPEGITPAASIVDTLDPNLAFVEVVSVGATTGVSMEFPIGTGTNPANTTIASGGQLVTFNPGNLTNTNRDNDNDEFLTIRFRAVVLNTAANQTGQPLVNTAQLSWTGTTLPMVQSVPVIVIEPALTLTKEAAPTGGDAGDAITFTMVVTNGGAASDTDAFDVALTDLVPAGMTYVAGSLQSLSGTAPAPMLNDGGAPNLTATWALFPANATRTITFQAILDATVQPTQVLTNTGELFWSSHPVPGGIPRSIHNGASTDRDGSGGINDYSVSDPATVTVNNVAPSKVLHTTSEPHTVGNQVAVGEIVRYRIEVVLPEGTMPNLQIRDLLPNGLRFFNDGTATIALISSGTPLASSVPTGSTLGLALGSGPFGIAPWVNAASPVGVNPTHPLPDDAIGSSNSLTTNADTYQTDGDDPYFKLGDLVNADSDADDEYVVIEFNALVSNVGVITAGSGRNNRARVFVDGASLATSPGVSVTPAEPSITDLLKTATPASGDAGDTIHYTITYSNATGTNRTTAFDARIVDVLPTTLVLQPATVAVTLGGSAAGVADATAGNTVDVTIASAPPGGTVQIEYDAVIVTSIPPGGSIDNTANLSYTSLPGPSGTAPNPTGSTVPGVSGSTTGERQYTGSDGASVSVTEVELTKAVVATSESTTGTAQHDPAITDLAVGETVTFHLTATLHEGTTPQVVITDTLPVAPGILSVVSTAIIHKGANLHSTASPTLPLPDPVITITDNRPVGGDTFNDQVVFNFGEVLNDHDGAVDDDDRVIVEVVARVEDIPANTDHTTLVNAATLNFGLGLVNATDVPVEVVEPQLEINKSVNPTSGDAGDTVRFSITVNHLASSTADAFDLDLDDLVPAGLTYAGNLDCDDGSTDPDTCLEAGGTVTATWDHFPLTANAIIAFDATIDGSVAPGSSIINTATLGWDSLPDDGVTYDRDLSTNDDASVLITSPGLVKSVLSTSQPSTGTSQYGAGEEDLTIGEQVTFRIVVTVPEGTSLGASIVDQLPTTLSTPQGVLQALTATVALGANITVDADPGTPGDQPAVINLNDGADADSLADEVVVTLGTVINSPDNTADADDLITVDVTAVVADVATNQGGVDDLTNVASFDWTGAAAPIQGQVAVDLVEPRVAVSKTNLNPFGDAGDTITYEITVAHTATSSADVFDVVLDDTIPSGHVYLGLVAVGTDPLPSVDTSVPGHLIFGYPTIPLADSAYTFQVRFQLDGTVQAGASYTNGIAGVWDSLPGAGDPNDRPGSGGSSADVTINAPALVKVTSATSLADTTQAYYTPGEEDLAIGELVTYRVTVTFPEGTTSSAVVTDQVQADGNGLLEIYDARILTTGGNISTSQAIINPPPPIPPATTVVSFDFGTVTNSADNVIDDDDRMVLEIVARVVDAGVNADADHLVNLASLTYLNGSTDDDAWIDVVEPSLGISKTMNPPVNGVVEMTVQLTNSGTAPAYDLQIVDLMPAAMWDTTTITPVSIPAGFTFAAAGDPGDATVTLASDGMAAPPLSSIEPTETISFTFSAALAGGPHPASPVSNTATNTVATTLPGVDPGERDEPDVQDTAQLQLPSIEVDKSAALAPGGDLDGSGTASPGDILRYTISVTNSGTGSATNVVVTDPVNDPNTALVVGTVTTSLGTVVTGNTAGDTTVRVEVPSVPGPSTAVVTFDIAVANPVAAGVSQLVNWANASSDELPDEPSNDPSTGPDDDPTVVVLDAAPDLVVTKTDGVTSTVPGDSLTYTLTINNAGNQHATGVVVTDTLPTGTTFVSASDGGGETPPGSGMVIWPPVNLAVGASFNRTVSVSVDNPPPMGLASIDNTVTVADDGTNGPDPTPGNNTATDVDVLVYSDVAVTKTDNPDPVVAGETLTWTLTVTNNGVSNATGVVLNDTIPAGVTVNTISAPCAAGFPCTIGNLAAGANATVTVDVTVDSDTTGTLSNTAVVSANEVDIDPTNNTDSEPTVVGQSTDLEVVKTDSTDPVVAGEPLAWTLVVTNNGPSDATGVVLDDTFPAGVTVNTISAPCAAGFPCTIGDLAAGASTTVVIDVTVDSDTVGTLSNTATVAGDQPDPDPSNDDDTEPTDVIPVADLVITKTGPGFVASGTDLVFNLVVENLGPSDATTLLITDPTPTGLSFVSATAPCDTGFPCSVPTLAAGGSFSFDVTYSVPAGYNEPDPIINTASVSSEVQDPDPDNNTSSSSTAVDRTPEADLEIIKTGPPSAAAGSTVTYELTVTNNGPDDAADVVIDDPTPTGLVFASATAPCAGGFPCALGTVNSGASVTADVTFSIPAGYTTPDPISNTATVSSSTDDPDPGNNSDTETTPLGADTADLAVTKLGPTSALLGDDVGYTISVTNNGPATATGVVLDDPTPAGLTFVSATAPCAGGFPCTLGDIPAGDTVSISSTFNIPAGYSGADPVVNTVTVTGNEPDPDPSDNTDSASTGLSGDAADIGVVKTGPAAATQGTDVTFEITVTNHGPGTATAVSLNDPTPAGLAWVSVSDPCSAGFPCSLGDMAAGSAITLQTTFHVPSDYAAPDPIVNTATVSTTSPDANPANDSDTHPVDLAPITDLQVTKIDSIDPVVAGTPLSWTVTVTNNGPSDATGVVLDDALPLGVTPVSISAPCSGGFPCTIGNLAAGASVPVTINVMVNPDVTGVITNAATVTGIELDSDPTNNTDTEPTTVIASANLAVAKTDSPDPVVAGEALSWTITVTNNGPSNATGVVLDDTIPSGVTVNAVSAPCAAGFPCTIGNLAAGASVAVTIDVTVDSHTTGSITNTATVTGNEPDPDPNDDSDTEPTTVITETDLQVTKIDSPDPVVAGTALTWTITVANNGPSDATGVVLDDTLPPEVTLVSISAPCAAGFPCTIGDLAAGASVPVTVNVTVNSDVTGTINNTASVTGNETDTDPSNNTDTEPTTVITEIDLQVTKTDNPDPVSAGEVLVWTVAVTNNGPSDATGVILDDTLPAEVTLVSISAPCAAGFPCTIGDLAVGASVDVVIDVTVDPAAAGSITNTATVTGNETDTDPPNDSDTEPTTIIPEADLQVVKTANPDPVVAGQTLLWTIAVTNNGPSDATGVILDDTLPAEVTLVSISAPCAAGFPCTIGDLAVGASIDVTVEVIVDIATQLPISNTATVTGNEIDPDTDNNTSTVVTQVDYVEIEIVKTANEPPTGDWHPGDLIVWTMEVTNVGTIEATGIVLTDDVPELTAYYPESMTLDGFSLSDANDGDAGWFEDIQNRIVVDLDPIPAGGNRVVTFTVAISTHLTNGSHIIENTASVTTPTDPVNSDTIVVPVVVTGIPTVSDLGLAVLIFLIGLAGVMVVRRRVL